MNRRNFVRTLASVSAGFAILPGAGRLWRATSKPMPEVAFWKQDTCYERFCSEEYLAMRAPFEVGCGTVTKIVSTPENLWRQLYGTPFPA